MNHPLTRIFTPITMIIFVAVFTVAIATENTSDRITFDGSTVVAAISESDDLLTAAASWRLPSERP